MVSTQWYLEWKKIGFTGELNLFGLGWQIGQHYSVVMAAGILRLGDLWINWLATSTMGASIRDGTQTLSQRGFQCEGWFCKWPPTCSFDNNLMIIMQCGLLWWLKLGGIGKGIARLTDIVSGEHSFSLFQTCNTFPSFGPVSWGHMSEFWPMRCGQKWYKLCMGLPLRNIPYNHPAALCCHGKPWVIELQMQSCKGTKAHNHPELQRIEA